MKPFGRMVGPLGLTAWSVYALERYAQIQGDGDSAWQLFFRMLWSFDRISHISYRDSLVLSLAPERVIQEPYTAENWVSPPRFFCRSREELERYQSSAWSLSCWEQWQSQLPRNEFGYLHPEPGNRAFLGISPETYAQMRGLYGRCSAPVLHPLSQVLDALSEFLQEALEGAPKDSTQELKQAVQNLGIEPPPLKPFRIYRRGLFQDLGQADALQFCLGRPRPRSDLTLPAIFI